MLKQHPQFMSPQVHPVLLIPTPRRRRFGSPGSCMSMKVSASSESGRAVENDIDAPRIANSNLSIGNYSTGAGTRSSSFIWIRTPVSCSRDRIFPRTSTVKVPHPILVRDLRAVSVARLMTHKKNRQTLRIPKNPRYRTYL